MKRVIVFCLCALAMRGFANPQQLEWVGDWSERPEAFSQYNPFTFKISKDVIIITNSSPDRDIHCEILNEYGAVLKCFDIADTESAYIILPIEDLPDSNTYMIVLTSPNPSDRIYATFEK